MNSVASSSKKLKNQKAILLNTKSVQKLASNLQSIATYQLSQEDQFIADTYFAEDYVAFPNKDMRKDFKLSFQFANIKDDKIVLESGESVAIEESRPGLNIIQFLMIANEPLNNTADKNMRKDVIIIFKNESDLRDSMVRLVCDGCDNKFSWIKTQLDQEDCYMLRVADIPLPELLRLLDENDFGRDKITSQGEKVNIFRRLFLNESSFPYYVPWGSVYPALEGVVPKLKHEGYEIMTDGYSCITLPDRDKFKGLYDKDTKFFPKVNTRNMPVLECQKWPELTVPVRLKEKTSLGKKDSSMSIICLIELSNDSKHFTNLIEEVYYTTPESELSDQEVAVFRTEGKEFFAIRCRKNIEEQKALLKAYGELFQEWKQGNRSLSKSSDILHKGDTTLFLPIGNALFPDLRKETYMESFQISHLEDEIVILRHEDKKFKICHIPKSLFKPLLKNLVQYTASTYKTEVENIVDASVLEFQADDFNELSDEQIEKEESRIDNPLNDAQRDASPTMPSNREKDQLPMSSKGAAIETDFLKKEKDEIDKIVHKARVERVNNPDGEYSQILSLQDWQRLFSLTYACKSNMMTAIQPSLADFLFTGNCDGFLCLEKFQETGDEEIFRERLNVLFTETLSVLPDKKTFILLLEQIFGKSYFRMDETSVVIQSLKGVYSEKGQTIKKKNSDKTEAASFLYKEIERALLLSVIPELSRKISDEIIDELLPHGFALYKKLLIVIHELYDKPWQQLINKIVDDYEHAPVKLWDEIFKLDSCHGFLDENSKKSLPVKLVFNADIKTACKLLGDYIVVNDAYSDGELDSILQSPKIPLVQKTLTLFYSVFCGTCKKTDKLSRIVTAFDKEVKHSKDLRLQWLFAYSAFSLTGDRPLFTLIRERIFGLIQKGQTESLTPHFIVEAIKERNSISHQILSTQTTDLFANNDPILRTWIRLLEAWQNVINNPNALGKSPSCNSEPDCITKRECTASFSGRDGFFCLMKKEFHGNESQSGFGSILNLFVAFLSMIEKASQSIPMEKILDPNDNDSELGGTLELKEFLRTNVKNDVRINVNDTVNIQLNWDSYFHDCITLLEMLLSKDPDVARISEMSFLLQDSTPELLMRFDKLSRLGRNDRLIELLKMLDWKHEMWPEEALEIVLTKSMEQAKAYIIGNIGIKESKFFIAYISVSINIGRAESALSLLEKVTRLEMAMPSPKQSQFLVDLCVVLGKMTSIEKVRYRERIKDVFQNAKYFERSDHDFKIGFSNITLLWEILQVFKWRTQDEADALGRVIDVERQKLLSRIKQDSENLTGIFGNKN